MKIENDLKYTASHEWVKEIAGDKMQIGITDYAQEQMGDIVFVDLPTLGDAVTIGDVFANIESVKAVSDVYSPVSGIICAVNEQLLDEPESINTNPYNSWLVEIESISETEEFMQPDAYSAFCETL